MPFSPPQPDPNPDRDRAVLRCWCVRVGDAVAEGDLIAEVETGLAIIEVHARRGGVVRSLHVEPGEAVDLDATICSVLSVDDLASRAQTRTPKSEASRKLHRGVLPRVWRSLGIGLALTLSTAWFAAAFTTFPNSLTVLEQRGHGRREWLVVSSSGTPFAARYQAIIMPRAMHYAETRSAQEVPGWASLPEPPAPAPGDSSGFTGYHEIADGFGWPWPALTYRFHGRGHAAGSTGDIAGGIALPPRATGAWYSPRALPLVPIWPGLLADWIIATVVLAAAMDGGPALRRRYRAARLRCEGCGYSVRGLTAAGRRVCPECGRPLRGIPGKRDSQ